MLGCLARNLSDLWISDQIHWNMPSLQSMHAVRTMLQGWSMQLHLDKAQHNVTEFLSDHNEFRPQRFLDANNQLLKYAS